MNGPIVFTNGVFDCFHEGHKTLLNAAASRAMVHGLLIVAVNSDASVKRLKGDARPVHTCATRMANVREFLKYLYIVPLRYCVVEFDADTPEELIISVRPNILIKGSDSPRPLAGEEFMSRYGGSINIVPRLPGYSTTGIINEGKHDSGS